MNFITKKYSSTYVTEVVKLLGVFALILGFELPAETEAIVGALFVLIGSAYTLHKRHKAGKEGRAGQVNVLGIRK